MKLRLGRQRSPRTLDGLTPIEQEQLVACGKAYNGEERTAQECLPTDGDDEAGLYGLEVWDVEDDHGDVVFNVWVYNVDSGSIFRAGTTTEVGAFIQNYLECQDGELAAALGAAHKAHADWPEQTCLRHMGFGASE